MLPRLPNSLEVSVRTVSVTQNERASLLGLANNLSQVGELPFVRRLKVAWGKNYSLVPALLSFLLDRSVERLLDKEGV